MNEVVIVDCLRTAVTRARRGALRSTRADDLAAAVILSLLERYPQVARDEIEDVILGCATPEGQQGMNLARQAGIRAGLPDLVPGMTVNRLCASGLEAIALAAARIRSGSASIILAGGAESMSMTPFPGTAFLPNSWLVDHRPEAYLSMGLTAERLARKYGISRQAQDEFALRSHARAVEAQSQGRFRDEIVPLEVTLREVVNGGLVSQTVIADADDGPRRDTSLEALGALRPVFHTRGTVTAGNSCQISDGAAAALVMAGWRAKELGLQPLARFVGYAVAGVPPELMGIGPAVAIPKVLAMCGLRPGAIGLVELNEAFAAQALAVMRLARLEESITNVNGGAIALGHPLGCTGARLVATLLREMRRRQVRFGMVSLCVGGGQGVAAVFEQI